MPEPLPEDGAQLAVLLRAVAAAERRLADAVARRLGLGLTDFLALSEVISGEPVGPVQLGRRLGLGSGASTALTDRMQAAGHIRRSPHDQDRRRVLLVATHHARQQLSAHLEPVVESLVELADQFTVDERRTIAAFLRGATQVYDAHSGDDAGPSAGQGAPGAAGP